MILSSKCQKGMIVIVFRPLNGKQYNNLCVLCGSNERSEWAVKQYNKIKLCHRIYE